MARLAHENSTAKGFWTENPNIAEKLMLIVSEIAEALEHHRAGLPLDGLLIKGGKPDGFGIELADAIIRIGDLAAYLGLDLEFLVKRKMAYNATRPFKHGKVY